MKETEIDKLLHTIDQNKVSYYLTTLIDKLKSISSENNKLGIFMIVVIFLYYLIDNSIARSINIGPISIDNLSSIQTFIPLFFAFLILRFKIINAHKAELIKIAKRITSFQFGIENSNIEPEFTDDFTRTLLPLSLYEEINKLNYKGASIIGCLGSIVVIPLTILLTFAPYFFEFIWLKDQFKNFSELNIYEQSSTVLTIWILALSFYYLIHTMLISVKEQKKTSR